MKKTLFLLIIILIPVFLFNCGPSSKEHEKLKEEVERLRIETEALLVEKKKQLQKEKAPLATEKESLQAKNPVLESKVDKLILDSEGLLNKARSLSKLKRYEEAKAALATLAKTYPGSKETKVSAKLSKKIDRAIGKRKAEIERKKQKAEATKRVIEKRKARAEKNKAVPEKKEIAPVVMAERDPVIEKKIAFAHATRHMKTRADKQKGIKWYHDKNSPLYMDNNSFQIYFGTREGSKPLLRLRVQHQGPDFLFVKSFTVVADWDKYVKDPAHFKRDEGSNRTWEWYDESLSDNDIEMIVKVLSSGKARVILKGSQNKGEHVITSAEKESIRNVLDAYLEIGGEL